MDKEAERQQLLKEARELKKKIAKFNLTDSQRKLERIELLHKYNDTKDHAQGMLQALAELEGVSTSLLYKRMDLNFDK